MNSVPALVTRALIVVTLLLSQSSPPAWAQVSEPERPSDVGSSPGLPIAQIVDAPLYPFNRFLRSAVIIDKVRYRTYVIQVQEDGLPYPVYSAANSIGMPGYETPVGRMSITRVVLDPVWKNPWTGSLVAPFSQDRRNPMGAAAIMLDSGIALHGTNQPDLVGGLRVSHGCVRHLNSDINEIAYMVVPGSVVLVLPAIDSASGIDASDLSFDFAPVLY